MKQVPSHFSTAVIVIGLITSLLVTAQAEMRTFTNNEGKKLKAEVVSKTETHVKLRTSQGKSYSIAVVTLSEADQDFIKGWKGKGSLKALAEMDLAKVMEAKGYTRVAFDEEMNHLFIDVKIDGKEGRFLLDTGAMATIMKTSSVEKYGLKMKAANVQGGGVGGGAQIKGEAKSKTFEMGGDESGEQTFYIMDLNHLPQNYAEKMDGILGGDFFKAKKAFFDYSGGILWVKLR